MTAVIGLVAVALFALSLRFLKVSEAALGALSRSRDALGVLKDHAKSDLEKQAAAQAAGLALFGSFFKIAAGLCVAAAPAAILIAAAAATGLTSMNSLMAALSTPWMLIAACAISVPAFLPRT